MEPNKSFFAVLKSETEKTRIILDNVVLMLSNRIYIKSGEKLQLLDPAAVKIENHHDNTFSLKANNGDKFAIKIVYQKITAIGKQSVVSEFLKDYAEYKKIIVAFDFNNKMAEYVARHQTQIFRESTLLQDIIQHRDQPKFEILSPTEIEQFKSEYNATDYTTKKLLRVDPICKYFGLKKGDIIRIIRPSPTSGLGIDYRIVY